MQTESRMEKNTLDTVATHNIKYLRIHVKLSYLNNSKSNNKL